jgi:hypothetical protein
MTTIVPPRTRLKAAANHTRRAAERAQDHDALELLDAVDETLAGPGPWNDRTLVGMATFIGRIAESLK